VHGANSELLQDSRSKAASSVLPVNRSPVLYDPSDMSFRGGRPRSLAAASWLLIPAVLALTVAVRAQQPNGQASMFVQFRQGPPFPIVAAAPNAGTLTVALTGTPGAPFVIATGPLHPGAMTVGGGQLWDLGTPPGLLDLTVLIDGTAPGAPAAYSIPASGPALIQAGMPAGGLVILPPVQAVVIDPLSPFGYSVTAASRIFLTPSKSVLFIQGDFDPGFGTGPTCRLADPSFVGFSMLGQALTLAGFSSATEVVDTNVTITPALLQPHGVVVLGSNRRVFTPAEETTLESFVRAGGGLVSYADATFGPGNVASDNQILSKFGMLAATDNFGGPVVAGSLAQHPIAAGVNLGFGGEGVSIVELVGNGLDVLQNVAPCVMNGGACLPYPVAPPSGLPNPQFSACAAALAGYGRAVATFDRNTFFNWPGYGTNILDHSNLAYALNLFLFAAGF
jgi:hypothetical protein